MTQRQGFLCRVRGSDRPTSSILWTAFLYEVAFSTFWSYVGLFAVERLGASARGVGILFLVSAAPAGVANYLSGRLSDRFVRKRLIALSFAANTLVVLGLVASGGRLLTGFALVVVAGVVGAPAYTLSLTLITDVVEPERRELAYARLRVAQNVGIAIGPPLAGLLVYVGGWNAFLLGIAAIGVIGVAVSARSLPATGGLRAPAGGLKSIARDARYLLLLGSTILGFFVYAAFQTVLPVVAVTSYGLSAPVWGVLFAISPVLILLLQVRITRRLEPVPVVRRLAVSLVVMAAGFLILLAARSIAALAAVIVVFVLGEMVWSPTAQALAARLSPPNHRGAYLGAFTATTGPAWTLMPFIAFSLRSSAGNGATWLLVAGFGLAAAALGAAAARGFVSGGG